MVHEERIIMPKKSLTTTIARKNMTILALFCCMLSSRGAIAASFSISSGKMLEKNHFWSKKKKAKLKKQS